MSLRGVVVRFRVTVDGARTALALLADRVKSVAGGV
jgi:hypothetical protein